MAYYERNRYREKDKYKEGIYSYCKDSYAFKEYIILEDIDTDATEIKIPSEIEGLPVKHCNIYFSKYENLEKVTFPDTVESLMVHQFYGCKKLKEVILPKGIQEIPYDAFHGCKNLNHINLPDSVEAISESAFENCESLKTVTCSKKLKTICGKAFGDCSSLETFSGGDHVTKVEPEAFYGCKKLKNQGDFFVLNGILCSYIGKDKVMTIPEGVKTITKGYYFGKQSIQQIILPSSLEHFSSECFKEFRSIQEIELPEGVLLKPGIFHHCTELKEVKLPIGLSYIPRKAFAYCKNLRTINFPVGLTSIGTEAFVKCTALQEIAFGQGFENICSEAFRECQALENIIFPSSLQEIGKKAFLDCTNLQKIAHKDPGNGQKILKVHRSAFYLGKLGLQYSPTFLSALPKPFQQAYRENQIRNWGSIKEEDRQNLLKEFQKKKTIREMFFQAQSPELLSLALSLYKKLSLDELDDYITRTIEAELTEMTAILLAYKQKHYNTETVEAFEHNKALVSMGFEAPSFKQLRQDWTFTCSKEGVLISGYKGNETDLIIPGYTDKRTPVFAVNGGTETQSYHPIETLVLEEGIQQIGIYAFYKSKLKKITLPDSLVKIRSYAFQNTKIEKIHVKEKVTHLGRQCFSEMTHLTEARVDGPIDEIPYHCFSGCKNLKEFIIPPTVETIESGAFSGCSSLTKIEIPSTTKIIETRAFAKTGITELRLPEALETFNLTAINQCPALKRVLLPSSCENSLKEKLKSMYPQIKIVIY